MLKKVVNFALGFILGNCLANGISFIRKTMTLIQMHENELESYKNSNSNTEKESQ